VLWESSPLLRVTYHCLYNSGNNLKGLCKNQSYQQGYGETEMKAEHLLSYELDFLKTKPISFPRKFKFLSSIHRENYGLGFEFSIFFESDEWVCGEVLKTVPHRHFVFSIPKTLRRYFLYDRSLLSKLSRCAWELRVFSPRRSHKRVRSLGCLRPSSRNVCHLLSKQESAIQVNYRGKFPPVEPTTHSNETFALPTSNHSLKD